MQLTANDQFELRASVFYQMTGQLAPGKDRSPGSGPYDEEVLLAEWTDFNAAYARIVGFMFKAIEQTL